MVGPIMQESPGRTQTVELLQDLGLKEYESRCFLALTQLDGGTAKEISDVSDVPRTRVYDATRVLEAKGLVEVQHSNPQQFRAVSVSEATTTLRQQYDDRIDALQSQLEDLDPAPESEGDERLQQVWSLSGHDAIGARTGTLVEGAEDEIVLIVIDDSVLTDQLFDQLQSATHRGVSVIIGAISDEIRDLVRDRLTRAEVFETELTWLVANDEPETVGIGRLLLADRSSVLVSSFYPGRQQAESTERAVFAAGLGNGFVVLMRRMLATGLLPAEDPAV